MKQPEFTTEVVTDPVENARNKSQHDEAVENSNWLYAHWSELLPQAIGKYVGVSGQEPFISDNLREAERMARAAHPEDKGVIVQYVSAAKGMRVYGGLRRVASGE